MTDAEWQTSANPGTMLIDPRTEIAGYRKVGLYGIACLRAHELINVFEDWRAATEAAEATLDQSTVVTPSVRIHRNWSPPFATRHSPC